MEKLCVFCVHLYHESGGYGEYADPDAFYCKKQLWPLVRGYDVINCGDLDKFRERILMAETCPEYKPPRK